MNKKKIAGLLCWLVAFAIPFQSALLDASSASNIKGLINFVAMVALVFVGYMLVDGADSPKEGASGH